MPWPLSIKLHLFAPSPIGKVFKEHQHRHREDKQFSTVHRVMVPEEEIVADESIVPVTARLGGFKDTAEFAVATSGGAGVCN